MLNVERSILRRILTLQRRTNIHSAYYLIPILLSFGAAFFEGIGMGLLIPMVNGFLTKDYSFLKNTRGLNTLLELMPSAVTASDQSLFIFLLSTFVIAVLLKNSLRYCSALSMNYIAVRSIHYLRKSIFTRYLTFGKLYFDRANIGHDSTVVSHFAKLSLRPLLVCEKHLSALFSLTGYLVVMSFISWHLTVIAIPLFVLLHILTRRIIHRMHAYSSSIAKSTSLLSKHTVEILALAPFVQSFNMQEQEMRRQAAMSDESVHLSFRMSAIQEVIAPFQEIVTLMAVVVLFAGMLMLMVRGSTGSPPSFLVYFYLVLNAANKFGTVLSFRAVLAEARGSVDAVMDVLDDDGKYFVPSGSKVFTGLSERIALRDLHFTYNGMEEIISGLTFSIEQGKMTAIVGATGGGKTTIIHLLLRHYDCPPGTIFLDGVDIRSFTTESIRRHVALVSQETFLLHDTLRSNIIYGSPPVSDQELFGVLERARLKEFVQQLPQGLDTQIGDRGVKLSGGEKQRVSIARALLRGANILILDEATSSLDLTTERLIQEAIQEAIQGKTAIVIAHRLSTIRHADHVVVIDRGRCVEEGTVDALLAQQGVFRRLWDEQKFS